jgi:hypothetical protein
MGQGHQGCRWMALGMSTQARRHQAASLHPPLTTTRMVTSCQLLQTSINYHLQRPCTNLCCRRWGEAGGAYASLQHRPAQGWVCCTASLA